MVHLTQNVAVNQPAPPGWLRCCRLMWDCEDDIATAWQVAELAPARGFDGIVATDVIFDSALVPLLLRTMHCMLSTSGVVFVCVQVRHIVHARK